MLQAYADSLVKKGPMEVPDFTTYQPGITQVMAPAGQAATPPAEPAVATPPADPAPATPPADPTVVTPPAAPATP
jgi:hypothetical protein